MGKHLLFVYGTLRKHERNHDLLKDSRLVAEQSWTKGRLIDTGHDFPALVLDSDEWVYGELYEVSDDTLKAIDQLEGYQGDPSRDHYMRDQQLVHTDFGEYKAYTYFYPEASDQSDVPFGDWRLKKLLDQGVPLYFAYGSCMDHERIEQAGMLDQFQSVGLGLLKDHDLRFTVSVHDGGRADIVESHGHLVEGIVYDITEEALNYLYQREGVYIGMYRPAVVDVDVSGKVIPMLTFIVKSKVEEVAPPDHYLHEILRGGKTYLSETYLSRLEKRVQQLRAGE